MTQLAHITKGGRLIKSIGVWRWGVSSIKSVCWAGGSAQWLRALLVLVKAPGSIPSNQMKTLYLLRHQAAIQCTDADKENNRNKSFFKKCVLLLQGSRFSSQQGVRQPTTACDTSPGRATLFFWSHVNMPTHRHIHIITK